MIIYNKENIITNEQIEKCIRRYNIALSFGTVNIVVSEKRGDIFRVKTNSTAFNILFKTMYWLNNIRSEGSCEFFGKTIFVNLYNIDGNLDDKKLYGIGVIIYEINHLLDVKNERSIDDYDNEAKKFLNDNSKFLKETLGLKEEYTVEEF